MPKHDPEKNDYLAVVSEWSSMTPRGGLVGNAYPLINLTTGEPVANPRDDFPNPGAVFLTNRGTVNTWDFVILRPRRNDRYTDASERDCYYIPARLPDPIDDPNQVQNAAIVLDHPTFDVNSASRQMHDPAHNVTPLFFVRKDQSYYGPLVRTNMVLSPLDEVQRIDWRPAREDGIVYEITRDQFIAQGLNVVPYTHPDPHLNRVIASPLRFVIGNVRKAHSPLSHDALSEASLLDWYLKRCPTAELPPQIVETLRTAFRSEENDNPAVLSARLRKIDRAMAAHAAFQEQRERFARQYLESELGKKRVQDLVEQEVVRKALEIQGEVDKREKHLAGRRKELDSELDQANLEHQRSLEKLRKEAEALEKKVEAARNESARLEQTLASDLSTLGDRARELSPLLAALGSGRSVSVAVPDALPRQATSPRPVFHPVVPKGDIAPIMDEGKFVDGLHANLTRQGLSFARDFIANVYTSMKASALNLIIGPPGYGKSMLVSALARVLGHEDALLRIAVRRSWSEDRYLLGFFDSFHGRYDPGSTGLVPRLLQAEADWKRDKLGIYLVLLDEFNLAAPEYYFSQLLQALPNDDAAREIVLYDPIGTMVNGEALPHRVAIGRNVRFWGTINYDETTERLSPRTLDRTGMIFLGEADVKPPPEVYPPAMPGATAAEVFEKFTRKEEECPEDRWSLVREVIDFLRSLDPALGPRIELSPRVRQAIKRYLANSVNVLEPRLAADFVIQQKILPVIRGRGDDFLARIRELSRRLAGASLARSAQHVEETLKRSEQQFGELDFLSY